MAKKPAKAAKKSAAKPTVLNPGPRSAPAVAVISEQAFRKLHSAVKSAEADKNESVGRTGSLIAQAVEKHNLNKKAYNWFRQLDRTSNNKLADLVDQFQHLCEIGGINKRIAEQQEMFSATERGTVASEPPPDDDEEVTAKPAVTTPVPRAGSFAEKMRQANGGTPAEKQKEAIEEHKTKGPTPQEIKQIADRAEATSTAKH